MPVFETSIRPAVFEGLADQGYRWWILSDEAGPYAVAALTVYKQERMLEMHLVVSRFGKSVLLDLTEDMRWLKLFAIGANCTAIIGLIPCEQSKHALVKFAKRLGFDVTQYRGHWRAEYKLEVA